MASANYFVFELWCPTFFAIGFHPGFILFSSENGLQPHNEHHVLRAGLIYFFHIGGFPKPLCMRSTHWKRLTWVFGRVRNSSEKFFVSTILKAGIELNLAAVREVKIRIIPEMLGSIFLSTCSLLSCLQCRKQTFKRMLSNSSRPRIVSTRPCNTTHIVQSVDAWSCNVTIASLHHIRFRTLACPTFWFQYWRHKNCPHSFFIFVLYDN